MSNLSDLARTGKIVHADTNTSASGKVVQRVLEGSAALKGPGTVAAGAFSGNPGMVASGLGAAVVEPAITGGLAKLSTNPNSVGSLMAPRAPATGGAGIALPRVFASLLGQKKDTTETPAPDVATSPVAGSESDARTL